MNTVNRSAAIIRPKRAFIKWANSCSPEEREYSTEYFTEHSSIVLIPVSFTLAEARKRINIHWENIFKEELQRWNPDEAVWPKDRTQKIFWQWFDLEFHSMVINPTDNKIRVL